MDWNVPSEDNRFLVEHVEVVLHSYRRWTGRDLVGAGADAVQRARLVWEAPFAVVSHTTDAEPRFNYGNQTALRLFEMHWHEFTALPSRRSAPPVHQDERAGMLAAVTAHGFAANYRGVRIASSGRRFWIEDGSIWNLLDGDTYHGQAAMFERWSALDE